MFNKTRLLPMLLVLGLVLALTPLMAANAQGGELPDLDGKTVVAVTENAYPPFNFEDPATGIATGLEYELMEEICLRLNCVVEWNLIGWDAMIPATADGQFDVAMDGITITAERDEVVDFSTPFATVEQFMLVRDGEDRFSSAEEFAADADLLIGSQPGSTPFYTAVYNILDGDEANPRIILFDSFGAAVQALQTGDVDMVVVDAVASAGYIGANPGAFMLLGEALTTEDLGFMFPNDSDLVEPVNAALAALEAEGYLDYLNNKWFFLFPNNAFPLELPDLEGQTIVAVTENAYPPFNFEDPTTGEAMGLEYDAMEEICQRLNCVVEWNLIGWDAMIPATADGQFDVAMDGITITAERDEIVDFSTPFATVEQFMLVRDGEDRFSNAEEFAANADLLIGSQPGSTPFYTAVYSILDGDEANPRIILFDTFGAAVQALQTGDVDMVVVDAVASAGYIGANPGAFALMGDALSTEDLGFMFPNDSELVEPINAALAVMEADGYLSYLNNKWFFLYAAG